jgi:lipoprotein-anchoring transpeptidase ErfK/SrfK
LSLPKIILIGSLSLFAVIGGAAFFKKKASQPEISESPKERVREIPAPVPVQPPAPPPVSVPLPPPAKVISDNDDFPVMDRVEQLFKTGPSKLPIVETLSYTSSVPWLKGRPAWIVDYAAHYQTSRHFIARSLNGKPDYLTQKVSTGSQFNVFRTDKKIQFYLLIDISRCKMGFYYVDLDTEERVLLKTYRVGLGRLDPRSPSGTLTPLGKYSLGSKIAIYKPGTMGYLQDQKTEMIRIFGTRWIPFVQEYDGATASAKGYGIHGAPWKEDPATGALVENRSGIGTYDSDGCIRLSLEDMEELFAIIITKPTFVEIVKDFHDAKLPGVEVVIPRRGE